MDSIKLKYFHIKGIHYDDELKISNDNPEKIRLCITDDLEESKFFEHKIPLENKSNTFLWKGEMNKELFRIFSHNKYNFEMQFYHPISKSPVFKANGFLVDNSVAFREDKIHLIKEISILCIGTKLDISIIMKDSITKEGVLENDFSEHSTTHTHYKIKDLISFHRKGCFLKDFISNTFKSIDSISKGDAEINFLKEYIGTIIQILKFMTRMEEFKREFTFKTGNIVERILFSIMHLFVLTANSLKMILIGYKIKPLYESLLAIHEFFLNNQPGSQSQIFNKIMISARQNGIYDFRGDYYSNEKKEETDLYSKMENDEKLFFTFDCSIKYLKDFIQSDLENLIKDLSYLSGSLDKLEYEIKKLMTGIEKRQIQENNIEIEKSLNSFNFMIYTLQHNILTYFRLNNEDFYIDENFYLLTDKDQDALKISESFNKELILTNNQLRSYFSKLTHEDYMFNYLSLFMNNSAKDSQNKSCFQFNENLNYDTIKHYLSDIKFFEGFFLYTTKIKESEIHKEITAFNISSILKNFEINKYNFSLGQDSYCYLDNKHLLAFTDFVYLKNFLCINVETLHNHFNKKFIQIPIRGLLLHESPHVIFENCNQNTDRKIYSPCVKGIHNSEKGENGDLLEYFISNGKYFSNIFRRDISFTDEFERIFMNDEYWKGNLESIREQIKIKPYPTVSNSVSEIKDNNSVSNFIENNSMQNTNRNFANLLNNTNILNKTRNNEVEESCYPVHNFSNDTVGANNDKEIFKVQKFETEIIKETPRNDVIIKEDEAKKRFITKADIENRENEHRMIEENKSFEFVSGNLNLTRKEQDTSEGEEVLVNNFMKKTDITYKFDNEYENKNSKQSCQGDPKVNLFGVKKMTNENALNYYQESFNKDLNNLNIYGNFSEHSQIIEGEINAEAEANVKQSQSDIFIHHDRKTENIKSEENNLNNFQKIDFKNNFKINSSSEKKITNMRYFSYKESTFDKTLLAQSPKVESQTNNKNFFNIEKLAQNTNKKKDFKNKFSDDKLKRESKLTSSPNVQCLRDKVNVIKSSIFQNDIVLENQFIINNPSKEISKKENKIINSNESNLISINSEKRALNEKNMNDDILRFEETLKSNTNIDVSEKIEGESNNEDYLERNLQEVIKTTTHLTQSDSSKRIKTINKRSDFENSDETQHKSKIGERLKKPVIIVNRVSSPFAKKLIDISNFKKKKIILKDDREIDLENNEDFCHAYYDILQNFNTKEYFSSLDILSYIIVLNDKFQVNMFEKMGTIDNVLNAARLFIFIRLNPIHGIKSDKELLDLENKINDLFEQYSLENKRFRKIEEKRNLRNKLIEILFIIKSLSGSE